MKKFVALVNKLPLPNNPSTIFGLAFFWWITDFLIQYNGISGYYSRLLASGALPPDADSISIPVFEYVFGDLALGFIFTSYLIWALWGMKPNNKVIKFNTQKPIRSSFSWLITLLWISSACALAFVNLRERNSSLLFLQILSFYCAVATNAAVQNK
jgi:magnesium-transporting ATPase (P-type)